MCAVSGHDVEYTRASLFRDGTGVVLAGTAGAKLVDGLEMKGDDKLIKKTRFSPFHQTPLDGVLRRCWSSDRCLFPVHCRVRASRAHCITAADATVIFSADQDAVYCMLLCCGLQAQLC
jgi:isochorismate hydrolase